MADLFENPIGTDGFEFVEFTGPNPQELAAYFERMGFTAVGKHRSKNVLHYKQNDINFILNMEPGGQPANFAPAWAERERHGLPSEGRQKAYHEASARGQAGGYADRADGVDIPCIEGIGGRMCISSIAMARARSMMWISADRRCR